MKLVGVLGRLDLLLAQDFPEGLVTLRAVKEADLKLNSLSSLVRSSSHGPLLLRT